MDLNSEDLNLNLIISDTNLPYKEKPTYINEYLLNTFHKLSIVLEIKGIGND